MAGNTLKKIVANAKKLRRANPKMTWRAAVEKSGAMYRAGKKIAGKVPAKKRARLKPAARHTDTKSHNVNIRVVSGAGSDNVQVLEKLKSLTGRKVIFLQVHEITFKGLRPVKKRIPRADRIGVIVSAAWVNSRMGGGWEVVAKTPRGFQSLYFPVHNLDLLTAFFLHRPVKYPGEKSPYVQLIK